MSSFLEQYGKSIFIIVLIAILISFASPFGATVKDAIQEKAEYTDDIGTTAVQDAVYDEIRVVSGNVEAYKKVGGTASGADLAQSEYIVPKATDFGYSDNLTFVGWYTDKDCTTPYMATSGTAYAKFIKLVDVFRFKNLELRDYHDGDTKANLRFRYYYNFLSLPKDLNLKTTTADMNNKTKSGYCVNAIYGTTETNLNYKLKMQKFDDLYTNIVFTNLPQKNYGSNIYAKLRLSITTNDGTFVENAFETPISAGCVNDVLNK